MEWGADEALDEQPHNRFAARREQPAPRMLRPAPPPVQPPAAARSSPQGQAQQAENAAAAAHDLAALRAAVSNFAGCALRDTASHTLFAEGDPSSSLMLIGEVPDADEDRAGHPFSGPPGALLERMLASIGLSREQILIAPLVPWRPPGDRKVSPLEMAACLPFLHRLVALAEPRHLVLMGTGPTRALLSSEIPLSRLRGRWATADIPGSQAPVQVLPMRHPGHLLANPLARRDAWHDLLLLRRTLDAKPSQGRE
jgi:uracil-DNA glycosylase